MAMCSVRWIAGDKAYCNGCGLRKGDHRRKKGIAERCWPRMARSRKPSWAPPWGTERLAIDGMLVASSDTGGLGDKTRNHKDKVFREGDGESSLHRRKHVFATDRVAVHMDSVLESVQKTRSWSRIRARGYTVASGLEVSLVRTVRSRSEAGVVLVVKHWGGEVR